MSETTPQEKAQKRADFALSRYMQDLEGLDTKIPNRFENVDLYGYEDMQGALNSASDLSRKNLTELGSAQKAQNLSTLSQSLASRGITGGSLLDNAITKSNTTSDKNLQDALAGINIAQLQQIPGLMQYANQNKMQLTQAQTGVDQMNFNNLLSKYGLKANATGALQQGIGNYDDTTFGESFGAALGTGARIFLASQGGV
jgi:hypothetical protein